MFRYLPLFALLLCFACEKEEPTTPVLELFGISLNGSSLTDGATNIDLDATFQLTFSAAIDPARFPSAFSLVADDSSEPPLDITYTNASSKVVITTTLEMGRNYELKVLNQAIGQGGEALAASLVRNFSTIDGTIITSQDPCTSATADCLTTLSVQAPDGSEGKVSFYGSYPLELENARWENIKHAVVVVHGQNRNADEYFSWMMSSLQNEGFADNTILFSMYFRDGDDAQPEDIYWPGNSWREGRSSVGPAAVSTFSVVDQLIERMADADRFPALETVIIAGHSSGACFTHMYATANQAENQHPELAFRYVVANSQYFYYPDDVRYDEGTQQFGPVSGCATFNQWPYGFSQPPVYLNGIAEATVDQQMVERKITYLLGTADTVTTGSLNTSDCAAVLLGEHRYDRGEKLFLLMETLYTDTHQHSKVLVPGIGHNAQAMFQSGPFLNWLRDELE